MKKRNLFISWGLAFFLAVSAAAFLPAGTSVAWAEEMWSEDYYRASDTSGELSDAETESLDQICLEFMQNYKADLSLLAVTSDVYEGATLSELAAGYYENSGFGYGPGKDGFQVVWDITTDEVVICAYGAAQDLIPQSYLDHVAEEVVRFKEDYGVYGPLYASTKYLNNYMEGSGGSFSQKEQAASAENAENTADPGNAENAVSADNTENKENTKSGAEAAGSSDGSGDEAVQNAAAEAQQPRQDAGERSGDIVSLTPDLTVPDGGHETLPDGEKPDGSLRVGEGSDLPAWYPKDTSTFPYYHDADAPRVVDEADIFSDQEETQMEERLAQLRGQLSRDIVVFTDVSTHGLSQTEYADDFYDYNGYGIGEDFEGVCLMICMDPNDRGWWTSCSGPVTRGLYTETVANQIDDLLYEYMVAGDYGEGVADWIENFRRLYTTGSPFSEEWALLSKDSFERFHDENAPRVLDEAKILRPDEIERLTAEAAAISEKYGLDVVIHTVRSQGILERDEYGDRFWYFNGYGYGDNYDGIMLTIFKRPNYSGGVRVTASGKGLDKLTEINKDRLESRCQDVVLSREYYEAASNWLDQTGHMLRTGRAPRSSASWGFVTLLEMLAGAIFGGISLGRAKSRMVTPSIKENANAYVVPGSLKIRKVEDTLIDTTVQKQYSPRPKESRSSGGSSGGGRSSYSSSHTSSSGRTHSGSGRKF